VNEPILETRHVFLTKYILNTLGTIMK